MTQPRAKKIGLKEVAAQAGVSISAVSMALADSPQIGSDTKARVRAICRELGYPPKGRRSESGRRRRGAATDRLRIGFMTVGASLQDEALSGVLHGLAVHAAKRRIRLEISATEDGMTSAACSEQLHEFARGLDGLIASGLIQSESLATLADIREHTLVLGHLQRDEGDLLPPAPTMPIVATDNTSMGRLAVRYLTQRGHRRIAFFCERVFPGLYNSRWLDGYRLGLEDADIEPDGSLVHVVGCARRGGAPAADAFSELAEGPTAFVCPDVRTAASFLERRAALGKPVARDEIVLGGLTALAPRYGLQDYPLLSEEPDRTADVALDYIERLIDGAATVPVTIIVPFGMHNLD